MVNLWKRLKMKQIRKKFQFKKSCALLHHWRLSNSIIATQSWESEVICLYNMWNRIIAVNNSSVKYFSYYSLSRTYPGIFRIWGVLRTLRNILKHFVKFSNDYIYFFKNVISQIFDWALNTPLYQVICTMTLRLF